MKSAIIILCLLSAAVLHAAPPGYVWHGKGDQSTRDKDGIYVWFVPGLSPLPGDYKVVGRLRSGHSGTFTLRAVDNFTGAERFSVQSRLLPHMRITNSEPFIMTAAGRSALSTGMHRATT